MPADRHSRSLPPPTGTKGFTIIELLTVLTIMLIVLSIASLAAIDWARTTGMRASVTAVEAGLIRARQHAVTQRQRTWFYTADPGRSPAWFGIETDEGLIGTTNTLRRGIAFHSESDTNATFTVRGSVDEGHLDFILTEPHRGERAMTATVTVYGVTGHTEVTR